MYSQRGQTDKHSECNMRMQYYHEVGGIFGGLEFSGRHMARWMRITRTHENNMLLRAVNSSKL